MAFQTVNRSSGRNVVLFASTSPVLVKLSPGTALPSGSTFTRTTVETYLDVSSVLQSKAINTLINDAYNGGTRVFQLRAGATNKTLQNGDLTNAAWTVENTTRVLDGTVLAPDGTSSTKITAGGTASRRIIYTTSGYAETANTVITWSAPLKMGTARYVQVQIQNSAANAFGVNVDLQTGTIAGTVVGATTGAVTASGVISMGNGWYRAWVAGSQGTTAYLGVLNIVGGGASAIDAGDGTTGQYYYAALPQYEAGSFPTPIIKTTTAAVSRGVDSWSVAGVTASPATLFQRAATQNSTTFTDSVSAYTSGAAIVPAVGSDYQVIAVLNGTLTAPQAAAILGVP